MEPTPEIKDVAILAAKIAAKATKDAAWIQGLFTLSAGLFAIAAAWIGFIASRNAATRQVKLSESQYRARIKAYKFFIFVILAKLKEQDVEKRMQQCRFCLMRDTSSPISNNTIHLPEEFDSNHWETHSILGERFVMHLQTLRVNVESVSLIEKELLPELSKNIHGWGEVKVQSKLKKYEIALERTLDTINKLFENIHSNTIEVDGENQT